MVVVRIGGAVRARQLRPTRCPNTGQLEPCGAINGVQYILSLLGSSPWRMRGCAAPPRNACPRERLGTTAVLSTLTPALGQPGPEDEHGPSPSAAELQTCQGNLRPDLTIGYPLRRREGLRCVVCRISLADAVSHVGYLQSHVNMFQSICCACVVRIRISITVSLRASQAKSQLRIGPLLQTFCE